MLMMTSSPAPPSASSVTSVWRLSCHRPFTPASFRTLVHAVLNDVIGRVGSLGGGVPKANTNHSGRHSLNRRVYQGGVRFQGGDGRVVQRNHAPRARLGLRLAHGERLLVNEVYLLPPSLAQFLVAETGVQVQREGCAHLQRAQVHGLLLARPKTTSSRGGIGFRSELLLKTKDRIGFAP